MKKTTLMCFILLTLWCQSYAQFTENFDTSTNLPTGWSVINQGGSNEWNITNIGTGAHSGTNVARIVFNTTAHDDYLISPAIAVTAGLNDRISFYIKSLSSTFLEPYEVLLSTTTNTSDSDFSITLQASEIASNSWTKKEFDLTAYDGQTIYIAIRATGTDKYHLAVDDFVNDTPPTCLQPTNLTASAMTTTAAILSWVEAGSASLYNVEVVSSGSTPTGTATDSGVTNSFNKTGLNPSTSYDYYVQADCGGGDLSSWSGPYTFATECDYFGSFTEGFESYATSSAPQCWSFNLNGSSGYAYVSSSDTHTGSRALRSGNSGSTTATHYIVSPLLTDMQNGTHQLRFYVEGSSSNIATVGRMGDPNDPNTFTPITTIPLTTTHTLQTVNFNTVSADEHFAIKVEYSSSYNYISIDDVVWEAIPSCPEPLALTATNVTESTADLGWTDGGTATTWNIEWGTTGFTQGTGTMITGTTTNPHPLSGLSSDTSYEFYVQADCGGGDTSAWFGPLSFTTLISCPAPSALTASAMTTTAAILSWTEAGSASLYNVEVVSSGSTPTGTATDSGVTNSFNKTGLNPSTSYDYYVQADCGGGDLSSWSGPYTFATECDYFGSFTEGFESYATSSAPQCWSFNLNGSSGYAYVSSSDTHTGSRALRSGNSGSTTATHYIVSPLLTDMQNGTHQLRFYVEGSSSNIATVGRMGDPNDPNTFTPITTIPLTTTHTLQTVNFNTVSADEHFAIKVEYSSSYNYISIDDVVWEAIPSCPEPLALTATNVTESTADLGWTDGGTATTWNIEWGTTGFTQGTGTMITGTTTNPHPLSGLSSDTSYEFYVQADCGGGDLSSWSGPFTFYTGHCIPSGTSSSTYIDTFTTTNGAVNIDHASSGFSTGNYDDMYNTMSVSQGPGATVDFSVAIVSGTVGCAIWIDWNNDLIFDTTEVAYSTTGYGNGPFTGTITVPSGVADGDYRMRVMIDFNDSNPGDDTACSFSSGRGEVEDYKFTVDASLSTANFDIANFVAYPNPVKDVLNLSYTSAITSVQVLNLLGQEVITKKIGNTATQIDMSDLTSGAYIINVTVDNVVKSIKVIKQ